MPGALLYGPSSSPSHQSSVAGRIARVRTTLSLYIRLAATAGQFGMAKIYRRANPGYTSTTRCGSVRAISSPTFGSHTSALAELHLGAYEDAIGVYRRSIEAKLSHRTFLLGRCPRRSLVNSMKAKTERDAALALEARQLHHPALPGGRAKRQSGFPEATRADHRGHAQGRGAEDDRDPEDRGRFSSPMSSATAGSPPPTKSGRLRACALCAAILSTRHRSPSRPRRQANRRRPPHRVPQRGRRGGCSEGHWCELAAARSTNRRSEPSGDPVCERLRELIDAIVNSTVRSSRCRRGTESRTNSPLAAVPRRRLSRRRPSRP